MSPKTINVVVPAGPRSKPPRRMGVFIKGVGIIQVDVPFGLQKGDQFSFQVKENATFTGASSGTTLINCPDFSQPGDIFHHRIPNGKNILVSVPPPDEMFSYEHGLLVPNVLENEHMIVQAQVALKPSPKPTAPKRCDRAKHKPLRSQEQEQQELRHHYEQYLLNTLSTTSTTGDEVADAQAQLMKRFQTKAQHTSPPSQSSSPRSVPTPDDFSLDALTEDEQLAYMLQESLKMASAKAIKQNSGNKDSDFWTNNNNIGQQAADVWYNTTTIHNTAAIAQEFVQETPYHHYEYMAPSDYASVQQKSKEQERMDFLNSLPDDIRQQVLAQETLQERAFN